MSLLVVGLSHRSAPVSVLERAAVGDEALGAFLHEARSGDDVLETMIVSTCNRVEVYAEVDKFHGAVADVSELLSRHSGVPLDQLTEHLYVHYGERALQHMFAVVCGLDSMAVGEGQILGQVRRALKFAQRAGTVGRTLGGLGQQALHVGKRAHAETDIDRVGASLVAAGLSAAEREIGSLAGKNVLVVGAGSRVHWPRPRLPGTTPGESSSPTGPRIAVRASRAPWSRGTPKPAPCRWATSTPNWPTPTW